MNEARRTCLSNYFRIDVMDHAIKNANLACRSWKHWHGAMLHAKGMAIVVAYDIYLEVCEGKLNEDWETLTLLTFTHFASSFRPKCLRMIQGSGSILEMSSCEYQLNNLPTFGLVSRLWRKHHQMPMERWAYVSCKRQREEGRRGDLPILLINSIIIVNHLFGLLKIHGHAMFAVIPHAPSAEFVTSHCMWSDVKDRRRIPTASWSFTIHYSLDYVRTIIGWQIGVRKNLIGPCHHPSKWN